MHTTITSNSRPLLRAFYAFFIVIAAPTIGSAPALARNAYISNYNSNTVSVIKTATNTVTATIPVGNIPLGVAVTPDGSKVYVTNLGSNNVSVFLTTPIIRVGNGPSGLGSFIQ